MKTAVRRSVASLLIVSMTSLGIPAQAGTVGTEETIAVKRDRIGEMLDRADVRAALEARGVSSSDAKARVEALTDQEVGQLAARIDDLPAGGNPIAIIAGGMAAMVYVAVAAIALVVAGVVGVARLAGRKSGTPSQESQEKPAGDASPFPGQGYARQ